MKTRTLLTLSLLTLLVAASAYAQKPIVVTKIPFAFIIGKATLPAGQYEFTLDVRPGFMRVLSIDEKSEAVFAPVITRLAAGMHTTPKDAHVVFDKVGDICTLSEIWDPGEDGYLLHGTKGKHEHQIVDVPK